MRPLLEVTGLTKYFRSRQRELARAAASIRAVHHLTFSLYPGETLGLVGESGSGKSTTAQLLLRLIEPDSGTIVFDGIDLTILDKKSLRGLRKDIQIVFQDPYSSLNPTMTVGDIIGEPVLLHLGLEKRDRIEKVAELISMVGLDRQYLERYPDELSGGQRQRIAIARSLASQPRFLVLDEPVSALDVSVQAQILNLLNRLQQDLSLTYLFISHDLSVVRYMSDRIAVMSQGEIVEIGEAETIYTNPQHPYTQDLLSAIPIPDPRRFNYRLGAQREHR